VVRFILGRLAFAAVLAVGVVTLVFVLMESAPGDPLDIYLGDRVIPAENRARVEQAFGFDQSPATRYAHWLSAILVEGEFGYSYSKRRPVGQLLRTAIPPTLALAATALVLQVFLGILLGVVSAAHRQRWPDRVLTVSSLILYAVPTFWLGLMAAQILGSQLHWFPTSHLQSIDADQLSTLGLLLDRAWHMVLPAGVLGVASAAVMSRFVRAGMLESLGSEFIRAARARGVTGSRVLLVHALRNAAIPIVNLTGMSLPILLSGSLVIEVVFNWPGMGRLTYDAIYARDFPIVLATTLLSSILVVVGNLLADLAMALVDPRIRLTGRRSS
jgi:peptide/nickel transport system permease protein